MQNLRLFSFLTLSTFFHFAYFQTLAACSCDESSTEINYTSKALEFPLVFTGKPRKITLVKGSDDGRTWPTHRVEFEVGRVLKALNPRQLSTNQIEIITNTNMAACGVEFDIRRRYLIYAENIKDQFVTSVCTPTVSEDWFNDFDAFVSKLADSLEKTKKKKDSAKPTR